MLRFRAVMSLSKAVKYSLTNSNLITTTSRQRFNGVAPPPYGHWLALPLPPFCGDIFIIREAEA